MILLYVCHYPCLPPSPSKQPDQERWVVVVRVRLHYSIVVVETLPRLHPTIGFRLQIQIFNIALLNKQCKNKTDLHFYLHN